MRTAVSRKRVCCGRSVWAEKRNYQGGNTSSSANTVIFIYHIRDRKLRGCPALHSLAHEYIKGHAHSLAQEQMRRKVDWSITMKKYSSGQPERLWRGAFNLSQTHVKTSEPIASSRSSIQGNTATVPPSRTGRTAKVQRYTQKNASLPSKAISHTTAYATLILKRNTCSPLTMSKFSST